MRREKGIRRRGRDRYSDLLAFNNNANYYEKKSLLPVDEDVDENVEEAKFLLRRINRLLESKQGEDIVKCMREVRKEEAEKKKEYTYKGDPFDLLPNVYPENESEKYFRPKDVRDRIAMYAEESLLPKPAASEEVAPQPPQSLQPSLLRQLMPFVNPISWIDYCMFIWTDDDEEF